MKINNESEILLFTARQKVRIVIVARLTSVRRNVCLKSTMCEEETQFLDRSLQLTDNSPK